MARILAATICMFSIAVMAAAQDAAEVGSADMVKSYLLRLSEKAFAERQAARDALATPEQIAAYQSEMRQFFTDQLGGFWEKGPLNPKPSERANATGSATRRSCMKASPACKSPPYSSCRSRRARTPAS